MKKVYFIPSPHSFERFDGAKIKIPKLFLQNSVSRFPLVASAAPLALGAAMFIINPNPMSIAFMAVSPLIVIANFFDTRWTNRKTKKKVKQQWYQKLDVIKQQIVDLKTKELNSVSALYPQISTILDSVISKSSLLWCRNAKDKEFLSLRIGAGNIKSAIEIEDTNEDLENEDIEKINSLKNQANTLSFAPVVENLQNCGSVGIVGKNSYSLMLAFIMQIVTLHRPKDLKISYVYNQNENSNSENDKNTDNDKSSSNNKKNLVFLENLPHFIPFESLRTFDLSNTHCVIFCISESNNAVKGPVEFIEQNKNAHLICLTDEKTNLPAICSTYIDYDQSTVFYMQENRTSQIVTFDYFDFEKYKQSIYFLSMLLDPTSKNASAALPKSILFSQLRNRIKGSPYDSEYNNKKLEAVVGIGGAGEKTISLVDDGPHVFIGGTTGCGKSEFIKSWILSLAVSSSVKDVNFLLIDYKGGSAFSSISYLPHCVGLVTDLSEKLFSRTQISLKAELKRRETIFNSAGVKDLKSMQEKCPDLAPPALVIVVDELAALVADIPEFLDGLIDIAARGRSLGLHLILATQRPAGVIKDNLRANANLRIALRVADENDSKDIIGSPRAAHFDVSTPGRVAIKCGSGEIEEFQSAYIDNESYLESTVESLQKLYLESGFDLPYKPWRDQLAENITFEDCDFADCDFPDALGLVDIPERQTQEIFSYDPKTDGNLVIYGSFGAGKTTFVESLVYSKSQQSDMRGSLDSGSAFYIISSQTVFSNISKLKTVGAVVDINDEELVDRIMDKIILEIKLRRKNLAKESTIYETTKNGKQFQTIYLVIDDFQLFREIYDSQLDNQLMQKFNFVTSAAQSAGIAVVLTMDRANAVPNKIISCFATRFIMKLVSEQDYLLLGVDKKQFSDSLPPGRGFYNGLEMQTIIIDPDPLVRLKKIDDLVQAQTQANISQVQTVSKLPEIVEANAFLDGLKDVRFSQKGELLERSLVLGLEYFAIQPFLVDAKGLIVITGPPKSGKSNLVDFLARQISNQISNQITSQADVEIIRDIHTFTDKEQDKALLAIANARQMNKIAIVEILECNNPDLWKITSQLKNANISICLQPDDRFSQSFSYIPIPKCKRDDFCVGKGLVFYNGKSQIVQTPLYSSTEDARECFLPSDEVYSHHQQPLQEYSYK